MKDKLYCYQAGVERVIDEYRLDVTIDLGFKVYKYQHVCLWNITPCGNDVESIGRRNWLGSQVLGKKIFIDTSHTVDPEIIEAEIFVNGVCINEEYIKEFNL